MAHISQQGSAVAETHPTERGVAPDDGLTVCAAAAKTKRSKAWKHSHSHSPTHPAHFLLAGNP